MTSTTIKRLFLASVWIVALACSNVLHGTTQSDCNIPACFPKLTSNTSQLSTLLIFGIFETPLIEKCRSFEDADRCVKRSLEMCSADASDQLAHWHSAKKLFDYICVEERAIFMENQNCLKSPNMIIGLQICDKILMHRSIESYGFCKINQEILDCIEPVATMACPAKGFLPKILKIVDYFVNDVISLRLPGCPRDEKLIKDDAVENHQTENSYHEGDWNGMGSRENTHEDNRDDAHYVQIFSSIKTYNDTFVKPTQPPSTKSIPLRYLFELPKTTMTKTVEKEEIDEDEYNYVYYRNEDEEDKHHTMKHQELQKTMASSSSRTHLNSLFTLSQLLASIFIGCRF